MLLLETGSAQAEPSLSIDLAAVPADRGLLLRVYGSVASGVSGLPVAGGLDTDGDGFEDYALAAMRASPLGRSGAGQVFLVFGDGRVSGSVDTALRQPRILEIFGDGDSEAAGSEIWMDDVNRRRNRRTPRGSARSQQRRHRSRFSRPTQPAAAVM